MANAKQGKRTGNEMSRAVGARPDQEPPVAKKQLSAKDGANAAAKYATALRGVPQHFSLEEVELSDDSTFWFVTLGLKIVSAPFTPKSYKVFKVNSRTGEVLSMKLRA
jgi:hypothetical protein